MEPLFKKEHTERIAAKALEVLAEAVER